MKKADKRVPFLFLLFGLLSVCGMPQRVFADEQSVEGYYYEKEFQAEGVKVVLSAEPDVVPKQARTSVTLVSGGTLSQLKDGIRKKMEAEAERKTAVSGGMEDIVFGRYYDVSVSLEQAFAFDFEITCQDEAGNIYLFEPKEGEHVSVSFEIQGLKDAVSDEMCEVGLFYHPDLSKKGAGRTPQSPDAAEDYALNPAEPDLLEENVVTEGNTVTFDADHFSVYSAAVVRYAGNADSKMTDAEEKAWNIINTCADPEYFLNDPYKKEMKSSQYKKLRRAALAASAGCVSQYDKIKAVAGFVSDRTYYDYKYYNYKYSKNKKKNAKEPKLYVEPYQVFVQKRTVCAGYTKLTAVLLRSIGIPCMELGGNNHAYNAAYDSESQRWIFLDTTWCSKNQYTDRGTWEYGGYSLNYFDLAPQEIAKFTSHEVYEIEGLLDGVRNEAYYTMESEHEPPGNGFDKTWAKMDWSLSVSGAKKPQIRAVSGFSDLEVKAVADRAFDKNKTIKKVDLSDTKISLVGDAAFYQCGALKTVLFPPALKKIQDHAFRECGKLKKIDLSQTKLARVGYAAFYGCNSVKTISLPASLKKIGKFAFGCNKKKKVSTSVVTVLSAKKIGCSNKKKYIWSGRDVNMCPYAYTVKFIGNGAKQGTMANLLCSGNVLYRLPANQFWRDGYEFAGWNTKQNGTGKAYKNKAEVKDLAKKNGKKVKLYAQWKKK